MAIQIQYRRGTANEWTSANPTLAQGEPGYETNTGKFKVGNGSTAWASLEYSSGPHKGDADDPAPVRMTSPVGNRVLRENKVVFSTDLEISGNYWVIGNHVVIDAPADADIVLFDLVETDTTVTGAWLAPNGTLLIAPWATLTLAANAVVNAVDLPRTLIV